MNVANNQVRATHKILEYDPIQKSFSASKYVIKAKDPRLHRITVVEHGFLLPEGSPVPEGIPLVGPSSSHQQTEAEADLGPSKEEFGVFDQVNQPENPSGDLGNPDLTEADFQSVRTSSQAEIGFKRIPTASLFELIKGQPRKDAPRKSQPTPQPVQTRSSFTQPKPPSPRPKLPLPPPQTQPPRPKPVDLKRKRNSKGKEPMDGGKSRSPEEEDEGRRASKQLKIRHQGQEKEAAIQSEP